MPKDPPKDAEPESLCDRMIRESKEDLAAIDVIAKALEKKK